MSKKTDAPASKIQIKHRWTGETIAEGEEGETLADAVARLVANNANLYGANLYGAHLGGAHLGGAHLGGAHLYGAQLPAPPPSCWPSGARSPSSFAPT